MAWADHHGMTPTTLPAGDIDPEALLHDLLTSGWLRLILPPALGGAGATPAEVAEALLPWARRHPGAGWMAWSQAMVVEALVRSPNVAVRETVLPDLLDGTRAGAVSWAAEWGLASPPKPVLATPLARGWRLDGRLEQVFNLHWMGYVVLCPVWFAQGTGRTPALRWTLLRSEEDGLRADMAPHRALHRQAACGDLQLQGVYFREDELLADDPVALRTPLSLLDQALRAALWSAALM
ncbi:MAG: hypothetical protein RI907_3033 [Pseudomonadota bacterium]|jgi:alkylation response protein AidB-like acyl-CoA dehydrogenase